MKAAVAALPVTSTRLATSYTTLKVEQLEATPSVVIVTLNRPQVANALNTLMAEELCTVWRSLYMDPTLFRCVLLTGAGDRAFCAGADLKERRSMDDEQWRKQHAVFEQCMVAMIDCPIPVIAAVQGAAFGGGLEIALAADFIYASRDARFALPEAKLGIMPGLAATQHLPRLCGQARAKEVILTGDAFDADEAATWGLVNRVCDDANATYESAIDTACRIAANAPLSVRQIKRAIQSGAELPLRSGFALELEAYNRTIGTQDRREGIDAYHAKRPPVFTGM